MTVHAAGAREPDDPDASPADAARPDAGRLDRDPEAMEDPVHRGDAQHQRELHAHGEDSHPTADRPD